MSKAKPKKPRRESNDEKLRRAIIELGAAATTIRVLVSMLQVATAEMLASRPSPRKQQRSAEDSRQASLFENSLSPAENVDPKPDQTQPK